MATMSTKNIPIGVLVKSKPPTVSIGCASNVFIRQMYFKDAGDVEQGHVHNYDHITFLATGKLLVEVNASSTVFTAPCMIFIQKDLEHKLTALVPTTTACCIHALRDKDISDDIIAPEMVPNGVALTKILNEIRNK